MPDNFLEQLEKKTRREGRRFWQLILLSFLILVLLKIVFAGIGSSQTSGQILGELGKDAIQEVSIALIISWVIFGFERRVRKLHLEQIQGNVLASVLGVAMPDELATELLEIIKEKVFREQLHYTITLLPCELPVAAQGVDPRDYMLLRREITYTLRNITAEAQPATVSSTGDWKYPFVAQRVDFGIKVEDRQVLLIGRDASPRNLVLRLKDLVRHRSSGVLDIQPEKVEMRHQVQVPGGGLRKIDIEACEVVRLDERTLSMVFLSPGVGLSVTLVNLHDRIASLGVVLNHRKGAALIPRHGNPSRRSANYHYPGAILPGQSFELSWSY